MRITVFTSNQPRHLALIERLSTCADQLYVVQECNTVFPGEVEDFFRKSDVMQEYFGHVLAAERAVFGQVRPLPDDVRSLSLKMGDLSRLSLDQARPLLDTDVQIVFGASYIRGPLCEALVERGALNIHMGVAPQYRGSSTNFWALYDRRPQFVGATIHRLTTGLDSGPILFHALPATRAWEPFELGMRAVEAAHAGLVEHLCSGQLTTLPGWGSAPFRQTLVARQQDRARELRYTRNSDFTDDIARTYLDRRPTPDQVEQALARRDPADYINPHVEDFAQVSG